MRLLARIGLAFLFVALLSLSGFAQSGIITTVAGDGTTGSNGDGGPATSAQLYHPEGVAVDSTGSFFIADYSNNRIRKVTSEGIISTVAGNGTKGYSGDDGPATSAQLNGPMGVAVDSAGNLFIADYGNSRIRKVTSEGIISTVAGNGTKGYSGDAGPAVSAKLNGPTGVTVDSAGNVLIADYSNNRIRMVNPAGVISTIAGNGTTGFGGDGGPATSAQFYYPEGIAVNSAGNLFIADSSNNRIRMVNPAGIISTVAGNGSGGYGGDGTSATSATLYGPTGVAVDSAGNLFIADYSNQRIRMVDPAGVISTVAGNGTKGYGADGGLAVSEMLNGPIGIAVNSAGDLFIADYYNNRIRKVVNSNVLSTNLTVSTGGSATAGTPGLNEATQAGYATVTINSGAAPYGTAVFSFKQNGVTVTEAGVPASPPTTAARIFIDYRSSVDAIPARSSAGTIDINTGIAAVNPGTDSADVTYTLRNIAGSTLSTGTGTLAAGAHFAKFINQIQEVAPDFVLPENFQGDTQFASLEISSTQPLSIIALRMTTNQRSEALFTTTPVADLTKTLSTKPMYFPQFADGGGYTTSIVLLNTTTSGTETGTFQILDDNGSPIIVTQAGGDSGSSFNYSIPTGGAFRFQTDGLPTTAKVGWVQVKPNGGTSTPVGAGVFGYNPENILVTESGVPATVSTAHARIYVDLSGGHNTGLAIANPTSEEARITINAFMSDGVTAIGTSQGPLMLSTNGHSAHFAGELIAGLPDEFTGVLDIDSSTPVAALTMRSLTNERDEFLLATFPIADMTAAAPSPIIFPHIADGGGYMSQFILIGANGESSATLNYYGDDGTPLVTGE
jgi:sugar lactone lactonase YvrE